MQTYPGKRALELLGAASACIAFTPVAVCIALAIWLEDAARLCTGNHATAFAEHRAPLATAPASPHTA